MTIPIPVGKTKNTGDGPNVWCDNSPLIEQGDVAICTIALEGNSVSGSLPEGFTSLVQERLVNSAVGGNLILVGFKVVGETEPDVYDTTMDSDANYAMSISFWRGLNADALVAAEPQVVVVDRNNPLPSCPSVTTDTDNCLVLYGVADSRGPLWSDMHWEDYYQPPPDIQEIEDLNESAGTGYTGFALGFEVLSTAGTTTPKTWGSIDNDDGGMAFTVAFRPSATDTGGGTGECVCDVEMQSSATHIQYRINSGAWVDVAPLSAMKGIDGADGRTPEMQTAGGVVQWKYDDEPGTAWRDLFAVPTGGDGSGTGVDGRTPELRADGALIQWKYTDETAWATLYDLSALKGDTGEQGPAGPAPQMRTSGDQVEWSHENTTAWTPLYSIPEGGGGSSTTIIVKGQSVTSESMGFTPTGDPVTDHANIQTFIDNIATDNVDGYLAAGQWEVHKRLELPNGLRLHGLGMRKTIINADPANWSESRYTVMKMDDVSSGGIINHHGIHLSDFGVIGADKNRTDNGGLVQILGFLDGTIERLYLADGSSYNLYMSGYGLGDFTNDITDDFWNSSFRAVVRDCLSHRGQIGFGTEGGMEHILFDHLHAVGNADRDPSDWGLHALRVPAGHHVGIRNCDFYGYRNGILLDRYTHVGINHNRFRKVRNGVSIGSHYPTSDLPAISYDVRINHNHFDCEDENGNDARAINDLYLPNRKVEQVAIQGNTVKNGRFTLGQCRRLNVTGNIGANSTTYISTLNDATGLVSNNLMELDNSASGIIDGGNNIPSEDVDGYI